MQRRETGCGWVTFFQIVVVEMAAFGSEYFNDFGRQKVFGIHCMFAHQQFGLRIFFQDNQHTAVCHCIHIGSKYVDKLNRLLNHHTFGYIQHETILCKKGVQGDDTIFFGRCRLGIIPGCNFGMLFREVKQTSGINSFRQLNIRFYTVVKRVVHHKIQTGTQIRYVTAKHVVRIHRNIQSVNIQTEVGRKCLVDIGILIIFRIRFGETVGDEIGQSLFPGCVKHFRSMAVHQGFTLRIEVDILLFGCHIIRLPFLS